MLARSPVSFIATMHPEKALAFYRDAMGLTLAERSPYALVFAEGESSLRVQIVDTFVPATHTVHGWKVSDIFAQIENLKAKGVTFLTFKNMVQSVEGIWTSPDGHKIAWFKDPSDNILSLTEFR